MIEPLRRDARAGVDAAQQVVRSFGSFLARIAGRNADRSAGFGEQDIELPIERARAVMCMPVGSEADIDRDRPADREIKQVDYGIEQPRRIVE